MNRFFPQLTAISVLFVELLPDNTFPFLPLSEQFDRFPLRFETSNSPQAEQASPLDHGPWSTRPGRKRDDKGQKAD